VTGGSKLKRGLMFLHIMWKVPGFLIRVNGDRRIGDPSSRKDAPART
jgi:hypothetical protein